MGGPLLVSLPTTVGEGLLTPCAARDAPAVPLMVQESDLATKGSAEPSWLMVAPVTLNLVCTYVSVATAGEARSAAAMAARREEAAMARVAVGGHAGMP
mmetsp:Transcript_19600/g.61683  ORF Transcript_19600/g.61683 Transcript_19600/m.61683 type:complete len:99 (+) Transcript_19600:770-1066(+)